MQRGATNTSLTRTYYSLHCLNVASHNVFLNHKVLEPQSTMCAGFCGVWLSLFGPCGCFISSSDEDVVTGSIKVHVADVFYRGVWVSSDMQKRQFWD